MNKSNKMDKESAAFTISGNEISCFFVLLPFQFLIVSYFFGLTNKNTLPNYVSDFLSIEFFAEESIEYFLLFCLWSFAVSIVGHYLIINYKKEVFNIIFNNFEYIISFMYLDIYVFIFVIYILKYLAAIYVFLYIICICFLYIPKCIDYFCKFIGLMLLTTLFICIIYTYNVRKNNVKIYKDYFIITTIGEKIRLNKCLRLGDFIYIDSDKPLIPISQIVKIQPINN